MATSTIDPGTYLAAPVDPDPAPGGANLPNPDTSQGLPDFASALMDIYNWLGSALLVLAGIALLVSAIILIYSFLSGRGNNQVAAFVFVIAGLVVGLNAGDIVNMFA